MSWLGNQYVIFALVAVTIFTVYMGLVSVFRKDPVRERLKRVLPADAPGVGFGYEENQAGLAFACSQLLTAFGTDLSAARRHYYLTLARAGMMTNEGLAYFLFFKRFVQPLFLVLAGLVVWHFFGETSPGLANMMLHGIAAFLLGAIGVHGAKLYVENRTQKRKSILQKSFSDALDLMLVCIESGLPLDGALARTCRELKRVHPEITEELDRTRVELGVLGDRVQALQNLADRTDTQGFKALVSALSQTEKYGTSVADTLRVLSEEYRTARLLSAENKAARIPALITVPLIFFILPAFAMIILGPPWIRLQQQGGLFGDDKQQTSR